MIKNKQLFLELYCKFTLHVQNSLNRNTSHPPFSKLSSYPEHLVCVWCHYSNTMLIHTTPFFRPFFSQVCNSFHQLIDLENSY